jgi:hypothetical protein
MAAININCVYYRRCDADIFLSKIHWWVLFILFMVTSIEISSNEVYDSKGLSPCACIDVSHVGEYYVHLLVYKWLQCNIS